MASNTKITKVEMKALIREHFKKQGIILAADFTWGVLPGGDIKIYEKVALL